MARVKEEVLTKVAKAIEELPPETINTCGLCNRTLYDHLTRISVNSGAPQNTVCEMFASRYNATKREEDKVPATAFRGRLQYITKMNAQDLSDESHQIKTKGGQITGEGRRTPKDIVRDIIKKIERALQDADVEASAAVPAA